MDRAPIVGPQHKPKCKQGEEIFLFFFKGDLLIEALTECQLRLHCLVWEMNEVGRAREGQKGERFRGVGAYAVSGAVCLLGSLLRQQVFDCVLDPNALIHPLGII